MYTISECKSLIIRNSSQGYWGGYVPSRSVDVYTQIQADLWINFLLA